MRYLRLLLLLSFSISMIGCGRSYHLKGHEKGNLNAPPGVTLIEGQRVRAISTGIVLFVLVPAVMESDDPSVVEVEIPEKVHWPEEAFLIARRAGRVRVRYQWVPDDSSPNEGFIVTVVPK